MLDQLPLELQLAACLDRLQRLQSAVFKHQWATIGQYTHDYELEVGKLKNLCTDYHQLPSHLLDQFQYLSNQQRRVMRAIFQAKQLTNDNLQATNQGLQKISQVKTFIA